MTERYPDLLPARVDVDGLSHRDAALAHAIVDAATRRWTTLGFLFEVALSRPWIDLKPPIQAALLAGGAQLLFFDRLPVYAVIDETVEWTKRRVKPGAGGLVNAGLRGLARLVFEGADEARDARELAARVDERFADGRDSLPLADGRGLRLLAPVLPEDRWMRLAVSCSVPSAVIKRWRAALGDDAARLQALHCVVRPPTILNVRFSPHEQRSNPLFAPHEDPHHRVFAGEHHELVKLIKRTSRVWVQDPSSSGAVASAAELTPRVVIDYCAGQGTKTRQLALTFPKARILATDTDERRVRTLRQTAEQYRNVEVAPIETVRRLEPIADLILADVPCGNTGVLARRPEARYRAQTDQLERLVAVQRDILRECAALLAPGGSILYATCSIEAEENRQQAAWAGAELGLAASGERAELPAGLPGDGAERYHDGAYSVLLTRR